MSADALRDNIKHMKEMIREVYVFSNQLEVIKNLETTRDVEVETKEKRLLINAINAILIQLKIVNNSIPRIIQNIGYYKKLPATPVQITRKPKVQKVKPQITTKQKLVRVKYKPYKTKKGISITISDKDKKEFLENLSRSHLSIKQLKKKYAIEKPIASFGRPNLYAKISNHFFRRLSKIFVAKGYLNQLNRDLRRMNSQFVVSTYTSMIFFTMAIVLLLSVVVFVLLLFFDVTILYPFLTLTEESIFGRVLKFILIIPMAPILTGLFMYIYPSSEAKNIGGKVNQELPFVAIHMAAIATSRVEPISIFKIILKSSEYKYTNIEFRKLMNLINFH
jgi:hypothetical protein